MLKLWPNAYKNQGYNYGLMHIKIYITIWPGNITVFATSGKYVALHIKLNITTRPGKPQINITVSATSGKYVVLHIKLNITIWPGKPQLILLSLQPLHSGMSQFISNSIS